MSAIQIEIMESGTIVAIENKSLVFGRSRSADVRIQDDRLLSHKHFQISLDDGVPVMTDLGSTNGTMVNGNLVQTVRLNDGDIVEAGNTHLRVKAPLLPRSEPAVAAATATRSSENPLSGPASPVDSGRESADRSPVLYSFNPYESYHGPRGKLIDDDVTLPAGRQNIIETTQSSTEGGLVRLEGRVEDASEMIDVVNRFLQLGGLYLVVDFGRLGRPVPEGLEIEESCLFDWLPPSVATEMPVVVPVDENSQWKTIIEHGWGGDAIEILRTPLGKSELMTLLRKLLRGAAKEHDHSRGVNGLCWPSVLASMLQNDTNDISESLMKSLDFAMLESVDEPEGWQLFTNQDSLDVIGNLGFRMLVVDTEQTIQSEPAS